MSAMFTYHQRTGKIEHDRLGALCFGYSGSGEGKNNPAMQSVHGVGPLPVGDYTIEPPEDRDHTGPYSLRLTPWPGNVMFGRGSFLIHGDKKGQPPGFSSEGCIVLPPMFRYVIGGAVLGPQHDNHLRVVAE